MCRLMAYAGSPILAADLLFRPSRSIVRQSFDAKERANGVLTGEVYAHGQLNADGFGMAFYASLEAGGDGNVVQDEDKVVLPCVFTESQPAWNSKNLRRLAEKVKAPLFFAHIRAAGPDLGVCDCKTHPFTYGRFSFMHNGEIAGFASVRRQLLNGLKRDESFNLALAHGATDTAVAFALFVDQLSSPTESMSSFAIVQVLKNAVKTICDACDAANVVGACKLNFVVTDGLTVVATRYTYDRQKFVPGPSLYYASGTSFAPTQQGEEQEDDGSLIVDPSLQSKKPVDYRIFHSERRSRMTIIASEPLTEVRSDWVSVPDNHAVIIVPTGDVLCAPFYLKYEPCLRAKSAVAEMARSFSYLNMRPYARFGIAPSISDNQGSSLTKKPLSRNGSGSEYRPGSPGIPFSEKSPTNVRTPIKNKPPMIRCRSSRHHSSLDEEDELGDTAATKRPATQFAFSEMVELSHPSHILSASGQVHVSAMVVYGNRLFSADGGAAGGRVCVYDLSSLQPVAWSSHWGILALCCDESRGLLFGSRSDGETIVWDISNENARGRLIAKARICMPRVGHVLSMCTASNNSVVLGSQDGFIRRLNLPQDLGPSPPIRPKQFRASDCATCCDNNYECMKTCGVEFHPAVPQVTLEQQGKGSAASTTLNMNVAIDRAPMCDVARSHCGFVMAVQQLDDQSIFSAGSCGLIKRWDMATNVCLETFGGHQATVMDLAVLKEETVSLLFSASADGTVRVWDVSNPTTAHFLRPFRAMYDDPLACITLIPSKTYMTRLCAGSVSGAVWVWEFSLSTILSAPDLPCQMLNVSSSPVNAIAAIPCTTNKRISLAVGAGSGRISLWSLPQPAECNEDEQHVDYGELSAFATDNDALMGTLSDFVEIKSVSVEKDHREDCFASAKYLTNLMERMDCETRMCFVKKDGLPCVLGRMFANAPIGGNENGGGTPAAKATTPKSASSKFIFVYGHYDVVPVGNSKSAWTSNAWHVSGREGYLYGRGVSDNKGPCLAMLFAAAELRKQGLLNVDVVFCFEGEGETNLTIAQRNLDSVFRDHVDFLSGVDAKSEPLCVVISNNTWVNRTHPCVTYGMRGVLDIEVAVESKSSDLHSGVHGGAVFEPMEDLVELLHSIPRLKEKLEAFVSPISEEEMDRLSQVANVLDGGASLIGAGENSEEEEEGSTTEARAAERTIFRKISGVPLTKQSSSLESIIARWASSSVSVSTIRTSNPDDSFRLVPRRAFAKISVHLAQGLSSKKATEVLEAHFAQEFHKLLSKNELRVTLANASDPWVGDVNCDVFQALSTAVERVWNMKPLYVREGGSYSGITSYLEKQLGAHAVHFPMAQSGDGAHLQDERISVQNLLNGKRVFEELLKLAGDFSRV